MAVNAVGFVLGIGLLFSLDRLPAVGVLVLACLVVAFLSGSLKFKRFVAFFVAGFVTAFAHASFQQLQQLPAAYLGTEVEVTGTVTGLPEQRAASLRFLLKLESLNLPETPLMMNSMSSLVRLSWYGSTTPPLVTGDRLKLLVKLRRPNGFLNRGGFDYEKYLYQQRIVATGYVRSKPPFASDMFISHDGSGWLAGARNWIRDRLLQAGQQLPNRGLILALAVGDRSAIESSQWDVFIATGTNHLLAISGLHITLIGGFCALLARTAWRYSSLLQRIPRDECSLYAALFGAFIYAAMAGFSVPTQRALLMFCVLAVFSLLKRHQRRSTGLAFALIAVCAINPMSVMAPGFWMSFAAVAILYLVFAFAPRDGWQHRTIYAIRGHFLITLGLYPLTVLFFQQASLVSPVANFVAVPVVGLLVTPAVFVCSLLAIFSVPLATALLSPVDWVLSLMSGLLAIMAQWPFAVIKPMAVSSAAVFFLIVAAMLVLLPLRSRLRWLAVVLVLPLLFPAGRHPPLGTYRVTFLDVGQGTSVVVQTRSHSLVYDAGPQYSASFNAADAVIIPYLRSQGITSLDTLLISHNDSDHSGGAHEMVDGIPISRLMVSAALGGNISLEQEYCRAGDGWEWDEVEFTVLYPTASDNGSENDLSCVLRIQTRKGRATLLPGDIEKLGEQRLLENGVVPVEILMAPHHGSATSSTDLFVEALKPKHVVYTAGFENRFGFPKQRVAARYHRLGSLQYQTGNSGAISFEVSDDAPILVSEFRKRKEAFWRRPMADVFLLTATLKP